MMRYPVRTFFTTAALSALLLPVGALADDWTEQTPYYEKDAWYDVTEWLDGNDYNPTDESWFAWDDETYDGSTSQDRKSEGYDQRNADDDWYYDYVGENHTRYDNLTNDSFRSRYRFYDYDNDPYYDAYTSARDTDGDGKYDDFAYFSFVNASDVKSNDATAGEKSQASQNAEAGQSQTAQNANRKESPDSSKRHQVKGKVEKTKIVKVRNGAQRLVAKVTTNDQQDRIVDLGPARQFQKDAASNGQQSQDIQASSLSVKAGDQITASGPMLKVGDKQIVLAQTAKIGDQAEQSINRSNRSISGKISKLKTAKVRGEEHQLAILTLKAEKQDGSDKQVLVDLGPKSSSEAQLSEGDEIQVTGVPVKIDNRVVILATSITKDGEQERIERVALQDAQRN